MTDPPICIGFNRYQEPLWGVNYEIGCAAGSAIFAAAFFSPSRYSEGRRVTVFPFCCRLPYDDVLTDEHVLVEETCPEHFVGTGAPVPACPDCPSYIRCTKINTERYRLGKKTPGIFWGLGYQFYKEPRAVMRAHIPVALRYGIGRTGKFQFANAGCMGFPYGSLLVQKKTKRCYGSFYRELRYQGLPGDPPVDTPVTMYSNCRKISDIFDPNARCIK